MLLLKHGYLHTMNEPAFVGDLLIEDGKIAAIAAASILAKVARDAELRELHERYPRYGFAQHKGYPTAAHRDALRRFGPCPEHCRSFAPVAAVLQTAFRE